MPVDGNLWYLIAFFGFIGFLLALWAVKRFFPNPQLFFAKHFQYATLLPSTSITRLQAFTMLLFLLANIMIPIIPIIPLPDWLAIQKRAAIACMVNVAPLCIGGGGHILNSMNVSRRWLDLTHSWVGIIATAEAVLHSIVVLSLRPELGNNRMRTSGWIAFGLLLGTACLSTPVPKKLLGGSFLWSHRLLSVGGVGVVFWHVLGTTSRPARILVASSCGFWLVMALLRFLKLFFFSYTGKITHCSGDAEAIKITIKSKHGIKVYPGSHFYIFASSHFTRYNLFHGYTAMDLWHTPEDSPTGASEIIFLLSRHGKNTSILSRLKPGQRVLLDGPYGQRQDLRGYQNVILAAEGIGIAAILPLALDIAARRHHDNRVREKLQQTFSQRQSIVRQQALSIGEELETLSQQHNELAQEQEKLFTQRLHRDSVKKVDIFWLLESNSQMDWVQEQLRALQGLDPQNKLFVVWCGYPCPRNGSPPFKQSRYWLCLDPTPSRSFDSIVVSKIKEERHCLPGSLVVTTSGHKEFTRTVRKGVLAAMKDRNIRFIEAEFQPLGMRLKVESSSGLLAEGPHGVQLREWPDREAEPHGSVDLGDVKANQSHGRSPRRNSAV